MSRKLPHEKPTERLIYTLFGTVTEKEHNKLCALFFAELDKDKSDADDKPEGGAS